MTNETLAPLARRVEAVLPRWPVPAGCRATLLNVSENVMFRIDGPGAFRSVLRVHRAGYNTPDAIRSELDWIDALRRDDVLDGPQVIAGHDGATVQGVRMPGGDMRRMVMFDFIPGTSPGAAQDLIPGFVTLGAIAARCHDHAQGWVRPTGFDRMTWDVAAAFGPKATWGDWRAAPGVDAAVRRMLEQVEATLRARLAAFGTGADRFGLIHADMRFANLLVEGGRTRLIDFDDCGFGWFLYDFAAAVSFIEDDPRLPDLWAAWLSGYRRHRAISDREVAEVPTFVMLRRMMLLAWIGSHIDAPEPQALAPGFAAGTARLGARYLARLGARAVDEAGKGGG